MSSKKIKNYRETKMYFQNGTHEGKIPERIYHEGQSREGRRTQNELSEPGQADSQLEELARKLQA